MFLRLELPTSSMWIGIVLTDVDVNQTRTTSTSQTNTRTPPGCSNMASGAPVEMTGSSSAASHRGQSAAGFLPCTCLHISRRGHWSPYDAPKTPVRVQTRTRSPLGERGEREWTDELWSGIVS